MQSRGLVSQIQKNNIPLLKFFYNDKGHRVRKESFVNGSLAATTYYVRNASGSTLAVYKNSTLAELPIYGISRLGVYYKTGNRNVYQLTDHLGNVRAVITKAGNNTAISSSTDYYPFGMPMPSRQIVGGEQYRYSFQGQEKDPETGKEAFQLRLWDGRIGRWLSPDPKKQYHSPYTGMGNNPINGVDPDGGCFTTDDEGNIIPCPDMDIGSTMVGNAGFEWIMTDTGWDLANPDDRMNVGVYLYEPTVEDIYGATDDITMVLNNQGETIQTVVDFDRKFQNQQVMDIINFGLLAMSTAEASALRGASLVKNRRFSYTPRFTTTTFNNSSPISFAGANLSRIKAHFINHRWKIVKTSNGWKATNPSNSSDVYRIVNGWPDASTSVDLIKRGPYLKNGNLSPGLRIPLEGNPTLLFR